MELTELIELAFKEEDHDTALQFLPSLRQPANVRTSYNIVPHIPNLANADDVSLLHLAAFNGWIDIVTTLLDKYSCNSQCCDSKGQTPLHYAAYGGSRLVVKYLISEQHCDPMHGNKHNGGNSLHCACLGGHLDLTKYLVTEHGCDINLSGSNGDTPLHAACSSKCSSLSIVKYLINELHCNPKCKRQNGRTPFHDACAFGHMDIIQYFIADLECDLALLDNDGNGPIHIACLGGCLNIVQYFVTQQDSDPNSRGESGRTPLHCACAFGHMDIVQYLITDQKCDPELPDNDGKMPIHMASIGGHLNVVRYLVTEFHCDPSSRDASDRTPLHHACLIGHMDIIQFLITDQQCDPALPDDDDDKPINYSCLGGHLDVTKYLITEKHCNPKGKGKFGRTPLFNACDKGHMDIITYLVTQLSCDPALPDDNDDMPIHYACNSGHLNVVKLLVTEYHCDPNSKGRNGWTPLHCACSNGHMEVIDFLITVAGCDPSLPVNDGNMPIHTACFGGHLEVVKYLITKQHCDPDSRGRNGRTLLHGACGNGHLDIAQYLIKDLSCNPEIADNDGYMPIHMASFGNHLDTIRYLITEQQCDPNSRGGNIQTPLHCACGNGHLSIIQYLTKDLGCNPEMPDNDGNMPIHMASLGGYLEVIKYLITERNCDPNSRGRWGRTPLHGACGNGHLNVIQYLIKNLGCDPEISDSDGYRPIHIACFGVQLNVVKTLVTKHCCNPNSKAKYGRTPLHDVCGNGHLDIIQYLITELRCDPNLPDNNSDLPIHIACFGGKLNVVKYLITKQDCDPNSKGANGRTPLHGACGSGDLDIIQYLIAEHHCEPEVLDNSDNKPIHIACFGGNLHVVKYLIMKHRCDPNSKGQWGRTPLHHACDRGHMDIIQYLIKEKHCSPVVVDNEGRSPLHVACLCGRTSVVKWLLQDGRVDAECCDKYDHSPLDCAEFSENSYELFKLLVPLLKSVNDYPIHSFTKVVFTGNSGAGKSSLAQVVIKQANMSGLFYGVPKQKKEGEKLSVSHYAMEHSSTNLYTEDDNELIKVEPLTAGIDSYIVKSENIGNMVIYDLAGQSEYYFSQSVIMETVMRKTPAIFINLVDLSKSEEEIAQAIHYWLTFIINAISKAIDHSCVVMVGSHVDVLSEEQLESKSILVKDLMDRRIKKLNLDFFIRMDCRKANDDFFRILTDCQCTISDYSPPASVYCHMLYSFLQTKLDKMACQFHELTSYLSTEEESLLPSDQPVISDLLEYLSDKGLIIYLKNDQCQKNSWIVVKREVILKDVNGELYKPKYFRGCHPIASSTGIIRMSSLTELFPQYDVDMLVELMVALEFCHPVNWSDIETNLRPIGSTTIEDTFLFFPSLLKAKPPQTLTSRSHVSQSEQVGFGWCLGCMNYEYQFFTSRFLHVLLLRLAYTFPLPSKNLSKDHKLFGLERRCTVWTNGILWLNEDGISTVVEVIQQSRWVVVTMYHNKDNTRPVEYSKHRSTVLRLVLDLQKELAPDLDIVECLISPSLLQQHMPLKHLSELDLFVITDVAKSILSRKSSILSYKDGSTTILTKTALFFEPYHLLSPSSVCELMDSSKSIQAASPALLNEVSKCQLLQLESQSHNVMSLRKYLDNISIFAGRNPLVVAELNPDDIVKESASALEAMPLQPTRSSEQLYVSNPSFVVEPAPIVDLSKVPNGTLDDSNLSVLITALKTVYQWFPLGIHLGLSFYDLKKIEIDERNQVEMCKINMLVTWLRMCSEEKRNKQFLENALQELTPSNLN